MGLVAIIKASFDNGREFLKSLRSCRKALDSKGQKCNAESSFHFESATFGDILKQTTTALELYLVPM